MPYRWMILLTGLAALGWSSPAVADGDAADQAGSSRNARIVNGLLTTDYPAAGALLYNEDDSEEIDEDTAGAWCTGTLIGCQTFLTAAHCVDLTTDPQYYWVLLQQGGIYTVDSITLHPDYDADLLTADVAVLKLGEVVTGIAPQPLPQSDPLDLVASSGPQPGTIAGFGRSGGENEDYGLKRYGRVQVDYCSPLADVGFENPEQLCWIYQEPVGNAGEDSNTCNGDSGGPLFMDIGGTEVVAGVTSWGTGDECLAPDESVDANVYFFRSFIEQQLGSDPTSGCGSLPVVGSSSVAVVASEGSFDAEGSSASYEYEADSGGDVLRFGLNSLDDGLFETDFFVKHGSGASSSDYDCKADGLSGFGFCTMESPAGGTWSVEVKGYGGAGQFQLTASLFGTTRRGLVPAPEPGAVLGSLAILLALGIRSRSSRF